MEPELEAPMGVLQLAPVGLVVIEAPGTIRWANPAFFEASGHEPNLIGRDLRDMMATDGSFGPPIREAIDRALRDGSWGSFRSVPASPRERSGARYLDVEVRRLPATSAGRARALLEVHDVTNRVEEHRQAQLFYSSFLTSSNAIEITDSQGRLVDVNPAFERTYGYSRAECIGRRPNLVRSPATPPEVYARMWAELRDPGRGFWSGELQNRDRHGNERPVFLTITAVRDETGTTSHYLGVAIDLSERKSWERVAGHADRLTSLGQLAAGVAHEINTPLANVMLITESLRRRSADPWIQERLDTISVQVDTAARIVRGLLDFARRSEPQMSELDLRDVTRDATQFLKGKQSANVELEVVQPEAPVPIWGDRGQLIQVLTNLLNNAYDAMVGEGRIRVEVRCAGADGEVEVSDTGEGISKEALPHIFEPFFTTKSEGQGTGLGLAICHGIVQAHHGSMVGRNLAGGGASFLVTLPLARSRTPPQLS
jgi:two-component system, cell cycle sensor histidine kinase and response regulator CckA